MKGKEKFLYELLSPERLSAVVDIGANPIDGDPPYKEMLALGLCTVTGFEPQKEALARLNAAKGPCETYYGNALGDGATHCLHVTKAQGMSSLLEPDPARLELFNGFSEWGAIVDECTVDTLRLDDAPIPAMDFLKIDVQGGELSVFSNARQKLADTVVIQVEISFVPPLSRSAVFW